MTKYTKDHEWIRLEGNLAVFGITDHAQSQLGDVVFVELPEIGKQIKAGDPIAVVESVKAASDVYAPVSGVVTQINSALVDAPDMVNASAETDGWFAKLQLDDASALDGLMDKAAYDAFVAEQG
jgi:glycine cleavage system H protein